MALAPHPVHDRRRRIDIRSPERGQRRAAHERDYAPPPEPYDYPIGDLAATLQISDEGDAAFLLLNPRVRCGDEWEAWFFAHWLPGAQRYPSFAALMLDQFGQV